jgi:glycosyltransferase involved in cell wall biosynthesis
MRLVLCTEFYHDRGGAYAAALDAEWLLRSRGHEVIPFAARHPGNRPTPFAEHFVGYRDLQSILRRRRYGAALGAALRAVYSLETYRRLRGLIAAARPDVVHVHNYAYHLSASVFAAARNAGVPVVHTLHDYKLLCPQLSMLRHGTVCERCRGGRLHNCVRYRCVEGSSAASTVAALQNCVLGWTNVVRGTVSAYLCPSEFLRAKAAAGGLPAPALHCVPNFVRLDERHAAAQAPGGRTFLYAGRLVPEKGVGTLLRAMSQVPEAELVVAGEGPLRSQLETLAPRNVRFLGEVPRARLAALYRDSLAVVVPSEWYENCSLTVLEAFAAGRCVVASDLGGLPEQVLEGRTGLLFPPGHVEALAACLRRVAARPEAAADMGQEARQVARTRYSPEVHYARLERLYRSLA